MGLVVMAGILWSFQALVIRQIDQTGVWTLLFWRSLFMLPVLGLFVAWRAKGSAFGAFRKAGIAGLVGGLALMVAMAGFVLALQTTTVANACFLCSASPFLAAILGRIMLGETVHVRTLGSIAIALVGVLIMVRDGLETGAWVGNLAALMSAFGFASFTVALRWRRIEDTLPASVTGAILAAIVGASIAIQTGEGIAVPLDDVLWCALMGIVTLSGGMILYTFGSKVVPSAELALLSNVEVLLAPLWVWLLVGESASEATFVGGAVVLAAILFNAYSVARRLIFV